MYNRQSVLIKLKNDLDIRGYSNQSKFRYTYIVNSFLEYMEATNSNKKIEEYNEYDVIEYLKYLIDVKKYMNSSYNSVNSILKFFLEVTLEKNIGYKRLPNRKVEIRKKVVPSKETILYIINNTKNLKHKIIYSLAYGSGLRVSEIATLKFEDIDAKNRKLNVIGKGNKERITVLPEMTLNLLRKYVIKEKIRSGYLFKGEQGRKYINEGSISKSLSDLVKKLNINENVTMHSLRRSFATHMLRSGVNIEIVKELMGHNSLTTTSGYIEYVYKELKIENPLDI